VLKSKFLFITVLLACIAMHPIKLYGQSDEEKPDQVWKLEIEGNMSFPDILIQDQMATDGFSFWGKLKFWNRSGHELNEIELKKDVIRIRNFYNRRGFPNASVRYRVEDDGDPWKKKVTFTVNEQAPIRINDISFTFPDGDKYEQLVLESESFARARRKSEFEINGRYEPIKEPEVIGKYEQVLKNLGFAYVQVDIEAAVDTTQLAANLTVKSTLGPQTYFENISVEGDSTVTDEYLIRESSLEKGNKFSLEALQEAQREIFNHHLFRFATINIADQEQDSTLDLTMQVRENELRTVEASAGFGTEELLRGRISWTHRNAFGRAHRFTTAAKVSYIEQSLNLDYLFPYAFNTKSSFVISPFAQHLLEDSYELSRMGITNSLIYRYSRQLTGSLSYQFTRNAELSQQLDESFPDTTQNYNLSSLQLSGYYNEGFSGRGQQGWVVQPFAEISGFLGSSTFQFQKLSIDLRRYTPLTESTTLATRVQLGGLFATQEDSLPNNIRYYLGGTSSVRGWSRDDLGPKRVVTDSIRNDNGQAVPDTTGFDRYIPAGGRTFFAFNLEIRQAIDGLFNGFGIALFLDGGQIWRKGIDLETRPLQFGVGGGLRYRSPIGPVRLDVGYKVNPSPQDLNKFRGQDFGNALDRFGIHISVGQAF